jgi:hypothetical protein
VTDWIGGMGGTPVWAMAAAQADHASKTEPAILEKESLESIIKTG